MMPLLTMMPVMMPALMSAALSQIAPAAWAQDVDVAGQLATAKTAIQARDWAAALTALDAAEKAAPSNAALISNTDLARIYFFRGVVEARKAGSLDPAMNWWRRALVIASDFQPDKDVLPDVESQDVFYALSEEQRGKEQVVLNLPEDPGDVMIFIDGRRYEPTDSVYTGTHFVQMRCEDSSLVGAWYTLGAPPPDWLVLCSGGSYPSANPGGKPPKEPKPPKTPREKPAGNTGNTGGNAGGNTAGLVLMLGGGVLLAGSAGTNFLLVNPAYSDIQAANDVPGSVTADQAEALEGQFNTGRFLTIGLLTLGAAAATSGVVVTVVDWEFRPLPNGFLLSTRW